MKANRKSIWNDRAEVGVGTLIVFIAMVLVAAVAAAVLINTSGTLQQRAQKTGKEATGEVSSNLKVTGIFGKVSSNKIAELKVIMELSAGGASIDLAKLVMRYTDGTNVVQYVYNTADDPTSSSDSTVSAKFNLYWVRSVDSSIDDSTDPEVIKSGDLVELHVAIASNQELDPRKDVEMLLIPEVGGPVSADFRTPPTYGTATWVTLR